MSVQRLFENWLADTAFAFRLSNGRIITVPAEDLYQLGRTCFAASSERRTASCPAGPQPGAPALYFVGT